MTEQNTNTTYQEQVRADFEEFFGEQYHQAKAINYNETAKSLVYDAVDSDDVTGNGSGSYYMNRQKAKDMVLANIDYVAQICQDTDAQYTFTGMIADNDWESLDVLVRCRTLIKLFNNDEL